MKCLIRVPLAAWAVKYFQAHHRDRLDVDGITLNQTAKDLIGKIISGYMRKTAFEPWYFFDGKTPHLRIHLPLKYNRHGLTEQDLKNLSDILMDFAQRSICMQVALIASMPGVSRERAIRETFHQMRITEEDYDPSHFRRYFDRYGHDSLGMDFKAFRSEVTRSLKAIYDDKFVDAIVS